MGSDIAREVIVDSLFNALGFYRVESGESVSTESGEITVSLMGPASIQAVALTNVHRQAWQGPKHNVFGALNYLDWCKSQAAWMRRRGLRADVWRGTTVEGDPLCCVIGK